MIYDTFDFETLKMISTKATKQAESVRVILLGWYVK